MITVHTIEKLPKVPAVYAMYGGRGRSQYVAYVGLGSNLRSRVEQHLVRRDSSVSTGVSAASLNPDFVTEVRWWIHSDFKKQEVLEAAELVAFDVLEPALRSRGGVTARALALHKDPSFVAKMEPLFKGGESSGRLVLRTLLDALQIIDTHDKRLLELEERIKELESRPQKKR